MGDRFNPQHSDVCPNPGHRAYEKLSFYSGNQRNIRKQENQPWDVQAKLVHPTDVEFKDILLVSCRVRESLNGLDDQRTGSIL